MRCDVRAVIVGTLTCQMVSMDLVAPSIGVESRVNTPPHINSGTTQSARSRLVDLGVFGTLTPPKSANAPRPNISA